MPRLFRKVLAILISAHPHHVQEQNAALRGIQSVIDSLFKQTKPREGTISRRMRLVRCHDCLLFCRFVLTVTSLT